jgi:5-formyltetrahydrofolate cyclo-ligase
MGEHVILEKRELRRHCLAARRYLPSEQMAAKSVAICARVVRLAVFAHAQHIVAYASLPDEVDPSGIVDLARESGKLIYFPRTRGDALDFLAAWPEELRPGNNGILEPPGGLPLADASNVVFLIPGVAFDPGGARLGRGGGYYDRGLECHRLGFRVGLAAEIQVQSSVPRDEWDQTVDAVVTERRLLWSAARALGVTRSKIEETVQ